VAALKVSGDFEAQLNTINTIAFKDAAGLRQIGDGIRKIAKDTGLSLSDLTASYYDLLSAGVKTRDAQEVLNDAVKLGIGGLATTAEAVDLLTTAYNAYGLDAKGAAVATDQFAQAVADGKVKASEIAASFADVASVAKTYKVGIDQIAASYAFLTAQGVPASEVTTQMQRAIISLIAPSAALATAQKKLKINFEEEIAKKGLVPALAELREYADANHIPLIDLLGRIEAVKYTLATTGPNAAGFATELDHIRNSSGEAAKQMAERQKGLNFELSRFKALAKDAGITVGNVLLPKVTALVGALNQKIAGGQGGISAFARSVGEGFDKVVAKAKEVGAALEKVDFAKIGSQLSARSRRSGRRSRRSTSRRSVRASPSPAARPRWRSMRSWPCRPGCSRSSWLRWR
jgi:TP901 family phage tail tape measure protein